MTLELSASNPVVRFKITGISNAETPYVLYNDKRYDMHQEADNIWCSNPLVLDTNMDRMKLVVEECEHDFKVKLKLGIVEEDLF